MPELVQSLLTGKTYSLSKAVRIVSIRQAIFYMSKGVQPVDAYVSTDFKTNEPILVFIFFKSETQELYAEWQANRPNKEEKDE